MIRALVSESSGFIGLPKTGQTTCYDSDGNVIPCEGTGQDAEHQSGVAWPSPRFKNNGDGTITDNLTGLMWLKDANCFGLKKWKDALDTVADLNSNPGKYSCGGYVATYNDWVLPNINEIESLLINEGVSDVAAYLEANGFSNFQSNQYWSSTRYYNPGGGADYYWTLNVENSFKSSQYSAISLPLLPVRIANTWSPAPVWRTGQTSTYATGDDGDLQRGVAWPEPRFTENGDGTITDNLTGLMWLKNANCFEKATWQGALNAVADLNENPSKYECGGYAASYDDWRLPNRKELHSLVDVSNAWPALPSGNPFLDVQINLYWSSTTSLDSSALAWTINTRQGTIGTGIGDKTDYDFYIWPVRGESGSYKTCTKDYINATCLAKNDVNSGVVNIIVYGKSESSTCAGFLISPDLVLTAYHCFEDGGGANRQETARRSVCQFGYEYQGCDTQAKVYWEPKVAIESIVVEGSVWPGVDWSLIRLMCPAPPDYKTYELSTNIVEGEQIQIFGFPDNGAKKSACGKIIDLTPYSANNDYFEHDVTTTTHGVSGGPVINQHGQAIGIITGEYGWYFPVQNS